MEQLDGLSIKVDGKYEGHTRRVTFSLWEKYGKRRVYASYNDYDRHGKPRGYGKFNGYYDLDAGEYNGPVKEKLIFEQALAEIG